MYEFLSKNNIQLLYSSLIWLLMLKVLQLMNDIEKNLKRKHNELNILELNFSKNNLYKK